MQLSLAEETRQRHLIEQRFHTLADNHEEMIRFKDQYKEEARKLRTQIEEGTGDKEDKRKYLELKEKKCLELEERLARMEEVWKEKVKVEEEKWKVAERRLELIQTKMKETIETHEQRMKNVETQLIGQSTF